MVIKFTQLLFGTNDDPCSPATPGYQNMKQPRHVFIGGLMRSGTTLLARILNQHADVSAFTDTGYIQDEGQYLQSVFPVSSHTYGGPGRFAFDSAAHLTEASPLLTAENNNKLQREWNQYWNLEKAVLVEKSPVDMLRSRYLNAVFADSYFIFVTRHPIAVSIATQKWSGTSIFSLINHWLVAHEILRADLKFLERFTVLPYESLVSNPKSVIRTLEKALSLKESSYKFHLERRVNDNYFNLWNEHFHTQASRNIPIFNAGKMNVPPADKPLPSKKMQYLVKVPQRSGGLISSSSQMLLTNPYFEAQDAVAQFGERIESFGYSLEDLERCPDVITK